MHVIGCRVTPGGVIDLVRALNWRMDVDGYL